MDCRVHGVTKSQTWLSNRAEHNTWKLREEATYWFLTILIFQNPTSYPNPAIPWAKASAPWCTAVDNWHKHLCPDLPGHRGEREICCWERTQVHNANTNCLLLQQTRCPCQKSLLVPFLILPSFIHQDWGEIILIGIRQPPAVRSLAVISILGKPFHDKLIEKDSGLLKLPNTISGDFLKLTTSVPVNCAGWGRW